MNDDERDLAANGERFTERLLGDDPVVVRRRVLWGECDPAGVVYTPRFADYFVSASDWFKVAALGLSDRPGPSREGIAFPLRALHFDFQTFLAADDMFDMTVRVSALSERTFTIDVCATNARDQIVFQASGTHICFNPSLRVTEALPPSIRHALERHLVN